MNSRDDTVKLPSGWRMARFDEIAESIGDRVEPGDADTEYYVGLEHLDTDSLKIRRWGRPDDVEATKLRFKTGDIIFGRRRVYQRKVGVAEFDGICSAHAMVVRAKQDAVEKDFLPFFMQSGMFMERALAISVGSLSPTINWGTLRRQEFPLPPMDEQRRIAEILWAADEAICQHDDLLVSLRQTKRTVVEETLDRLSKADTDPLRSLWTDSPESGYSPTPAPRDTGHYVLALSALSIDGYRPGNLKPVAFNDNVKACQLRKGDFLVSRSNTVELVGLVGIFDEDRDDVSFPDLMMRVPLNTLRVNPRYLELVMLSRRGRMHMTRVAAGTSGSMKKINRKGLGALMVPCPGRDEQDRVVDSLSRFDTAISDCVRKRAALSGVKIHVLAHLLTPTMEATDVQ